MRKYRYREINNELTETILLAMGGDERACEELLEKYAPYILTLIHNFADVHGEEKDIAQEIGLQIYLSITSLESPYAFTSWLRRLVFNVVNNYADKHRRHWHYEGLDEALYIEDENAEHIPQEAIAESDTRKRLASLISDLPQSQRTVLFMYYYDDMSYKDIAQTLGIKVGTVATNLMKAKARLKKRIIEQTGRGNVPFGVAITAAFDYEAVHYAVGATAEKFTNALLGADRTGVSRLVNPGKATLRMGKPGAVACVCCCALIAGALALANLPRETVTPEPVSTPAPAPAPASEPPEYQIVAYTPDKASLTMHSESGQPNVNPTSADLVVGDNEGVVDGWRITNEAGVEFASGKGTAVAIPRRLAEGKYYLVYRVTSHGVSTATIKKEFYID